MSLNSYKKGKVKNENKRKVLCYSIKRVEKFGSSLSLYGKTSETMHSKNLNLLLSKIIINQGNSILLIFIEMFC